jgi:hypothetical protein
VIEEIRFAAEREGRAEREFVVEVKSETGEVIAEVKKLLHVRKKAAGV